MRPGVVSAFRYRVWETNSRGNSRSDTRRGNEIGCRRTGRRWRLRPQRCPQHRRGARPLPLRPHRSPQYPLQDWAQVAFASAALGTTSPWGEAAPVSAAATRPVFEALEAFVRASLSSGEGQGGSKGVHGGWTLETLGAVALGLVEAVLPCPLLCLKF